MCAAAPIPQALLPISLEPSRVDAMYASKGDRLWIFGPPKSVGGVPIAVMSECAWRLADASRRSRESPSLRGPPSLLSPLALARRYVDSSKIEREWQVLEAVCRGVSDDGYRLFYRPVDVREDSVPGLSLPSGAPVFREGVDGTIELVALHDRRAPAAAHGDWVHEGIAIAPALEDLLRDREVATKARRERQGFMIRAEPDSRRLEAIEARKNMEVFLRGAWRVENGGDGRPPKLSTEERCHLFASLAAIKGAEVMIIAAEAYVATPDVLWRVVDRLAKYAATGYLEALELGERGACELIVRACAASREPSASKIQSIVVAHKALQAKNQGAACKLASLLAERAANSIRMGECGAVRELCLVLEHCLGVAAVDGTCVMCKDALRWCLAAVSVLAYSEKNRRTMHDAGIATIMARLRPEFGRLRKKYQRQDEPDVETEEGALAWERTFIALAGVPTWADVDAARLEGLGSYAELWDELRDDSVGSTTRDARARHADDADAALRADGGSASALTDFASVAGESKGDDDDEAIEVASLLSTGSPTRARRHVKLAADASDLQSPSSRVVLLAEEDGGAAVEAAEASDAEDDSPSAPSSAMPALLPRASSASRLEIETKHLFPGPLAKFGVSSENAFRRERDIPMKPIERMRMRGSSLD